MSRDILHISIDISIHISIVYPTYIYPYYSSYLHVPFVIKNERPSCSRCCAPGRDHAQGHLSNWAKWAVLKGNLKHQLCRFSWDILGI
jgi:hypothetical protein